MITITVLIEADDKIPRGVNIKIEGVRKDPTSTGEVFLATMIEFMLKQMVTLHPTTVAQSDTEEEFEEKKKIFGDILKLGVEEKRDVDKS